MFLYSSAKALMVLKEMQHLYLSGDILPRTSTDMRQGSASVGNTGSLQCWFKPVEGFID